MPVPTVKLTRGIHVLHLFYRIDRARWEGLGEVESKLTLERLQRLCQANRAASHPRLVTFVNVGGKADLVFMIYAAELAKLSEIHRALERCFPVGSLQAEYSFLSVTELPEYVTTEEDMLRSIQAEGIQPGSDLFNEKLEAAKKRQAEYEQYR